MSRLKELGKARLIIIEKLLGSQELCKALKYEDSNFLDSPDMDDTSSLLNDKIYPFNYIPKLSDTTCSFVTFSLRDYRPVGNKFKSGLLHFQVIIHKDLIETKYDMLRYDFILSCIDDLFNGNRNLGIGELGFWKMDEFYINENYVGFYLQYKLWDFN